MAVGKSHRIVIEIEPELKERIYIELRARGLTLKDWFTQQATDELLEKNKVVHATKEKEA